MARAAPIELGQPRTLSCRHESTMRLSGRIFVKAIGPPTARLGSDSVMFSKETVRRFGIERCQSRIEAKTGPAVGTEDRVRSWRREAQSFPLTRSMEQIPSEAVVNLADLPAEECYGRRKYGFRTARLGE
jgi:hypothetical protein